MTQVRVKIRPRVTVYLNGHAHHAGHELDLESDAAAALVAQDLAELVEAKGNARPTGRRRSTEKKSS